jgi:uncharacterized membrane protein
MKKIISNIKSNLGTGLLTLLPIFGTIWVLTIIYNFFSKINLEFIENRLGFKIPGLQIVLVLIITFLIGLIVNTTVGRTLFRYWDNFATRIPMIKGVYGGIRQLTDTFSSRGDTIESKVVLVEWPRKGIWQIGFVTREAWEPLRTKTGKNLISVFIPTAPNPTGGYLSLIPEEDLVPLDISYNDGMKYVVSAGVVLPEEQLALNKRSDLK